MADGSPTETKAPASDPFSLCGTTIADKYRVSTVVGKGGFGVVYRGVHTGFGEPIAVKCLKIDSTLEEEQREELLTRLQDEGRVLHRLSRLSSSIVQALDVGAITTAKGQWVPYLVLEWLDGETLAEYLQARRNRGEGPMSLEQMLDMLSPAAEALALAHEQKVAHRDVKPENLYLTEVGGRRTLKVLDFGIAKVLSQQASFTAAPAATKQQGAAFTPNYGAPEQFNKKRGATGPWTDVFALALIVVEMVSGERALHGDDATQLYIAAADPASRPTLRYHGAEVSDEVERVIGRALAIEPADRYQDAGSFWRALQEATLEISRDDPAARDTSDTGEFVSRHDLDVDTALATPAVPSSRARLSSKGAVSSRRETERSMSPLDDDAEPASTDSVREPGGSSRWLPLVVVLALLGAALLFWRLQVMNGDPRPEASGSPAVTLTTPSAAFTVSHRAPRTKPTTVKSAPTSRDAGIVASAAPLSSSDAGPRGAGGAGGAAPTTNSSATPPPLPVAPEGMVFIPAPEGSQLTSFFLDKLEVSLTAYRACVMAGRCVRATRVVLTPDSARALGVMGVDETTKPEQLASAWGPRCNEIRNAGDHPVNCVNHGSATDYCRFVGKRLPTSAEWSLAAAGEPARRFPWGDDQPECGTACYGLNGSCIGSARQVASCRAGERTRDITPEGVLDLGANMSEWVQDAGKRPDPSEPAWRLLRGGNFSDEARWLPVKQLRALPPVTAHVTIGFRCAKNMK